jgi:hypothetical protein
MTQYLVELRGDVREVYSIEAESADEAAANWHTGHLEISEASGMELVDVREDDIQ